jgi:hypothetical protein
MQVSGVADLILRSLDYSMVPGMISLNNSFFFIAAQYGRYRILELLYLRLPLLGARARPILDRRRPRARRLLEHLVGILIGELDSLQLRSEGSDFPENIFLEFLYHIISSCGLCLRVLNDQLLIPLKLRLNP